MNGIITARFGSGFEFGLGWILLRRGVRARFQVLTYMDCTNSFQSAWCLRSDLSFTREGSLRMSAMALARSAAIAALKFSACFHFVCAARVKTEEMAWANT